MSKILFKNEKVGFEVVVNEVYENKPMIVIFPGGGYHHLSTRESIPVSNKFISLGYNTTIVYYSVAPFADYIQLKQANMVIEELSKKYNDIIVIGFSAGGHLAGITATQENVFNVKGMILCYPVVSFLKYIHEGTVTNFLSGNDTQENRYKYSINNRINKNTVPCFVWTTKTDVTVPYENTLMLIDALEKNNVFYRYHIYPNGPHGMALADETAIHNGDTSYINKEVATWVEKADSFIKEILKK